ncbi:amidohydrolase family protein [Pseudonocardia nematodicida]|uniref:Amidohydrolase family protein n=1 Tax=Pseudonocardia nematodicida TaxID=1206997 RepID=A0ABV1K5V2_9PSEU
MIIDCHGHFTSAPRSHRDFRRAQLDRLGDPALPSPVPPAVGDDEVREAIENNQLRVLRERGADLMIISPQASAMDHHVPDQDVATTWARTCNNLVHRVTTLFPEHFAGVCQLPQTPGGTLDACIAELRRCVEQLGFVGANLNPDPSGGAWTGSAMTDPSWFPLYEALVELDVPAMIHVSGSCLPPVHTLGAHYLHADTTVFMQLLLGDLFARFPGLRLVIPHGGGAVPYHWGRFEGLAARLDRPPLREHLMDNVWFDTCVYHAPGVRLLLDVVGPDNVLFASEMLGAVRGTDPATGAAWDDTLRYVDAAGLAGDARTAVLEGNARRVYPRLAARTAAHA